MMTVLALVSVLLMTSLTGVHGLSQFPKNVLVAEINNDKPITLTCNAKTDGPVSWKFLGKDVEDEDYVRRDGQDLTLLEVDVFASGEYSCWKGDQKLSSTYLLLQDNEEEQEELDLSCRAKSYDCNFTCTWKGTKNKLVRLGLGHYCTEGHSSCKWETSSDQTPDGEFHFVLSHSLSPYEEESTMLELTAEVISDPYMHRKTTTFYLRDIVQPDSPQIVGYKAMRGELKVTIEPPSSWSTPHSFFSLEHEIEYESQDDGKRGRSLSAVIPRGVSRMRVRSRDPLVPSPWSQWSPWKNVENRKMNPCEKKRKRNSSGKKSQSTNTRRKGGKTKPKDARRSKTQ
ncbi:interleukin-12 subunit beta [Menidia menidia]